MKKLCILLSVICMCSFLFVSCTVKDKDKTKEESTESTSEATTLSKEDQVKLQKELKTVEESMLGLLAAENYDEVCKYVVEANKAYVENLVESFPHDDYIVKAEKLGTYNEYGVYNIELTRESDPEYYYSGIQMFVQTERGYLNQVNDSVLYEFGDKHYCKKCEGKGSIIIRGSGEERICNKCDGIGFVL